MPPTGPHALTDAAPRRLYRPGELKFPRMRQLINRAKYDQLKASLIGFDGGAPASLQQQPGLVSLLGGVIDGNCRATILFERDLPFWADVCPGTDTPAQELAAVIVSDQKSDRDRLEQALQLDEWLRLTGETQKRAAEQFGFTGVQVSRLLSPLKMAGPVLAAYRARQLTMAQLAALRTARDETAMLAAYEAAVRDRLVADDIRRLLAAKRPKPAAKAAVFKAAGLTLTYPAAFDAQSLSDALKQLHDQLRERMKTLNAATLPAATVVGHSAAPPGDRLSG